MIIGIGIDIVELERIEELRKRKERFPTRILTEKELKVYENLPDKRKTEFLAGRFAAKEAYAKARGTGIGRFLSFQDIEIAADERGRPTIVKPYFGKPHLSISHSRDFAVAQVILED